MTYRTAILPAYERLPAAMKSDRATAMLLAIGLQESRLSHRRQLGGGPARGLWQFEKGTPATRGGVTGVLLHPASGPHLLRICVERLTPSTAQAIYEAVEHDDVLAATVARLLLWTDAKSLPQLGDVDGAWDLYKRTWRPGKPHPETWPTLYNRAVAFVRGLE